jgi:hypothetical protein
VVRVGTLRVVQLATWLQYIRGISYREPYRKKEEEARSISSILGDHFFLPMFLFLQDNIKL